MHSPSLKCYYKMPVRGRKTVQSLVPGKGAPSNISDLQKEREASCEGHRPETQICRVTEIKLDLTGILPDPFLTWSPDTRIIPAGTDERAERRTLSLKRT